MTTERPLDRAGRIGRLEGEVRILAAVKLANVALAMLWGFVVTFVFVRVLALDEFRGFLLLVAFANFTVSADFGFSGIIYARLRRHRLEGGGGADDSFRPGDMAALLLFMGAIVALGAVLIGGGMATGHIGTRHPVLFMAFYLLTATNIFAALTRRALAALDRNLLWELIDAGRRLLSIALLVLALAGVPILLSVLFQIALAFVAIGGGMAIVHRATGMRAGDWLPGRDGALRVRRHYLRDMAATMALTLSDVAAYNAPYLGIAIATTDPRPLLVFDFAFKMARALSAAIRALSEAMMPGLTVAFHGGRSEQVRTVLRRLVLLSLAGAGTLGLFLIVAGQWISGLLFDGKAVLTGAELMLVAAMLAGLALLCVSTYVHNGIGRFGRLLPPSLLFLAGSALSVPLALLWSRHGDFTAGFLSCYAATHIVLAVWHARLIGGVARR